MLKRNQRILGAYPPLLAPGALPMGPSGLLARPSSRDSRPWIGNDGGRPARHSAPPERDVRARAVIARPVSGALLGLEAAFPRPPSAAVMKPAEGLKPRRGEAVGSNGNLPGTAYRGRLGWW